MGRRAVVRQPSDDVGAYAFFEMQMLDRIRCDVGSAGWTGGGDFR